MGLLNGVEMDLTCAGKSTDNAFNGRFRQECLNEKWFLSPQDTEEKVESWRQHYNDERPLSALGNLSPREFAILAEIADCPAGLALWLVQELGQVQIPRSSYSSWVGFGVRISPAGELAPAESGANPLKRVNWSARMCLNNCRE